MGEIIEVLDFGGAESLVRKPKTLIVDIAKARPPSIIQDISEAIFLGFRVSEIIVSRVLRYVGNETGFLKGDPVPMSKLLIVAANIDHHLKHGGKVTLVDHWELLKPVIQNLQQRGFRIKRYETLDIGDLDFPPEYEFQLEKGEYHG